MDLLQLPPEILLQVAHQLGSSYFRKDIRCLLVCRDWLPFAQAALYTDLALSQATLTSLLSSNYAERGLDLIEKHTEILRLRVIGFDGWDSFPELVLSARQSNISRSSHWTGPSGIKKLAEWTESLDNGLLKIAQAIGRSTKLRQLRLHATSEHCSELPTIPRREYLSLPTIRAFLSIQNLKILDLDLCGSQLQPGEDNLPGGHICGSIAALLLTLRQLHLRMRSICPDVLKPQQSSNALSLQEVIVNLSLSNELPSKTAWVHPSRCSCSGSSGFLMLQQDIETQAKVLVARMEAPLVVRILTHSFPKLEMQSFDVLTGNRMIITEDSSWDSDGEAVESIAESEEESELESLTSDAASN